MASGFSHGNKDAERSALEGWVLVALGLLSVLIVYGTPISAAKGYDLFLFVGLSLGVVLVAAGLLTLLKDVLSHRTTETEASPSVQGWRLIVLGLLSPFVALLLANLVPGDPSSGATEGKQLIVFAAGLLVGFVLVVTGLLVLLVNVSSSRAEQGAPDDALPGGGEGADADAASRGAPGPWTLAGVVVASIGWLVLGLGPVLGLAGGGLAAIGRARGERSAQLGELYGLVVIVATLVATVV